MIKLHALWPNGSSTGATGVPCTSSHVTACCRNGTKTARKDPKRIRDAERFTQEPQSEHGQRHKHLLLSGICSSVCPALISSNNAFLVLTEFCGSLEVHQNNKRAWRGENTCQTMSANQHRLSKLRSGIFQNYLSTSLST